jgi:hypothetical protein
MRFHVSMISAALLASLLLCQSAFAGPDDREVQKTKQKLEKLLRHADELMRRGSLEDARAVLAEAGKLKKKLEHMLESRKKERPKAQKKKSKADMEKVLRGLRQGIEALKAIGQKEEAKRLERIAAAVKRRMQGSDREKGRSKEREKGLSKERQAVRRHLETLRLAKGALREEDRHDAVEIVERAMHALELVLEGRRDAEAARILRNFPSKAHLAEVLHQASRIWRKFGNADKAEACADLGAFYAGHGKKEKAHRDRERGKKRSEHHDRELGMLKKQLPVLRHAMKALLEEERKDAAHRVEQKIHAIELALKGRRDAEARKIQKGAPNAGQMAELLLYAAEIWKKFKHADKAEACRELGKHYLSLYRKSAQKKKPRQKETVRREKAQKERRSDWEAQAVKKLQTEISELRRMILLLKKQVEKIQKERR